MEDRRRETDAGPGNSQAWPGVRPSTGQTKKGALTRPFSRDLLSSVLVGFARPAELRDPHLPVFFDVIEMDLVSALQLAKRQTALQLRRFGPVEGPLVSLFALDGHHH